jgi:hypothetical protein
MSRQKKKIIVCIFYISAVHYFIAAIAEVVSNQLAKAMAQVRFKIFFAGFVLDKVTFGRLFSEYFNFPCKFSLHQPLHLH